jgi:phosphoribosylformylglycinamidine (FGAM) synthase PurS component
MPADPEGSAVTYTLSGTGSDNFSIDASGNITLASVLDYETATSYELTVVVDDGTYASTEVITVSVADVNEAPSLSATVAFNAFQENTATGTTIATSSVSDPEAGAITYSLSGTGSENFSVSSDGTVTLASGLDYETATAYAITLTASDGANSVSETLTINVGDINEAPSLTNSLAASSFAENVATGTTIATASASDPEAQSITYSISGTGSENFAIDADGNVTSSLKLRL